MENLMLNCSKKLFNWPTTFFRLTIILTNFLRNDEAPEIFGHMQGLSIVDANLHIKGTNLDGQIGVIDFSLMTAVTEKAKNSKTIILYIF